MADPVSPRADVYYWKCDSPRPAAERAVAFTAAKYEDGGIEDVVRAACRTALGAAPEMVVSLPGAGDHHVYRLAVGGRALLFRAAVDATGDDYMLAEAALTARAAAAGVPVPAILHTAAEPGAAVRWQLMELVPGAALHGFHRAGTLDLPAVAGQLGRILRRLHGVRLDGFGFVDTAYLRATGEVRCQERRYADYFTRRLDGHLAYVSDHGLLDQADAVRAERLLTRHAPLLELPEAVLVHRDPALWNILGTPNGITALIDWDDAVGGDPADDLGLLRCFYDRGFTDLIEAAYWDGDRPPASFAARIALHHLRNMLWKAQLRHQLGYFRPGAAAFLADLAGGQGLEQATRASLRTALADLAREGEP